MTTTTFPNMNQQGVGALGGSVSLNSGASGHSEETVSAGDPITPDPNRWFFSREQLENTPSRKNGIDSDKELTYRQQSANFIQDMGQRLQVNQLCINTAIVYMHRFYMYHSFTNFHRNPVSTASIFLAAKVEEQPRKLEHVIKVAHYCLNRDGPPIDTKSDAYADQAAELVMTENILLQTLGFDVAIDHPHTHVVKCCQLVRASKDLAQTSYFMATNSLHLTTMCLQHKPTVVACVCIHLTCKWSNWEIPRSKEGRDWFWYVDETVTLDLLKKLTTEFLAIIDKSPSRLKKKIMSLNPTVGNSTVALSSFPAFNFDTNMPIGSHTSGSGSSRNSSSSSTLGKRPSSAKPNPGYSGLPKQGKVNGSVQHPHPKHIQSSAAGAPNKNPPPYTTGSKQGSIPGPPMYPKDAGQHAKPMLEQQAPSSAIPNLGNRTSNSHLYTLPHGQQNPSHSSHIKSQPPPHGAVGQHFGKPQSNQLKQPSFQKPPNMAAKAVMPPPLLPPGMQLNKQANSANIQTGDKRVPDQRRDQPPVQPLVQPGFPPKKNVQDDKRQIPTPSPRVKPEKLDAAPLQALNATSRINESSKSWESGSSIQNITETPRIPPGRSSLFSPEPDLPDTPTPTLGTSSLGKLEMHSPLDDPLSIGARSETSHSESAFSDMNSSSLFPGVLEFESDNRNSTPKDLLSFGLSEVKPDAIGPRETDRSLSAASAASKYSSASVFSNWASASTQQKVETTCSNDSEPHSKKSKKHKKEKHKHKDKSRDRHEEKKEKEEKKHKDKTKDRTKDEKKHKTDKHKKERHKSKERDVSWNHDDQSNSGSKGLTAYVGRREDASKSSANRVVSNNSESGYVMSNVMPVPGLKLKIKPPRPPS